jgi:hypothetical protein
MAYELPEYERRLMTIDFSCEACDAPFRVDESLAGKSGKCRRCGHSMTIPRAGSIDTMADQLTGEIGATVAIPNGCPACVCRAQYGRTGANISALAALVLVRDPNRRERLTGHCPKCRRRFKVQEVRGGTFVWTVASGAEDRRAYTVADCNRCRAKLSLYGYDSNDEKRYREWGCVACKASDRGSV